MSLLPVCWRRRARRWAALASLLLLALWPSAAALAQPCLTCGTSSWVFQRSYYSHSPAQQVQINPRSYGGPYYTRPQGEYINSGQRWLRSTISIPGGTYDQINIVESWVQGGAQF